MTRAIRSRAAQMRFVVVAAALTVLGACNDTTPPIPADAIVGNWGLAPSPRDPPGSGESFFLQRNGQTLTGTGTFTGEAGPFGTIDIAGTVVGDSVQLDLTFKLDAIFGGGVARIEHFRGQLKSAS